MWRTACVVVLLPSLVGAQTAAESAPDTQRTGAPATVPSPTYRQFTYYRQIRRGTTEKAAVELVLLQQAFVLSPRSSETGILPLKLEFEAKDGITVGNITYPKDYNHSVNFRKQPVKGTLGTTMKLKIRVDKTAGLGPHTLKGKLTFQPVTVTGVSAPEQLDVEIPLNVVERNAKVTKSWPYYEMPKGELIVLIVLAPCPGRVGDPHDVNLRDRRRYRLWRLAILRTLEPGAHLRGRAAVCDSRRSPPGP